MNLDQMNKELSANTILSHSRTEESAGGAGEAHWRDPITHALENMGTTEAHALAIDVKKPCKAE